MLKENYVQPEVFQVSLGIMPLYPFYEVYILV